MVRKVKKRLDQILVDENHVKDLKTAEAVIRAGKILISERVADKPGERYPEKVSIRIKDSLPYVSRGGIKLEGALNYFDLNPSGMVCADIGASSGGFTDCLLQNGARHVYAIDVAYGQLDWKLRTDSRVTVMERFNVRNLSGSHLNETLDLAVFDTSFISLIQVIPPVLELFSKKIRILALVKPQFELPRHKVGSGGIVTQKKFQLEAVEMIKDFGLKNGLQFIGVTPSSIKGSKGNQEHIIYFCG